MQVIYQLKNVLREHFAIKIFKRSVKRENTRFIYTKKIVSICAKQVTQFVISKGNKDKRYKIILGKIEQDKKNKKNKSMNKGVCKCLNILNSFLYTSMKI